MMAQNLGATPWTLPPRANEPAQIAADEFAVVAVGAHMSGLPLNGELTSLGGRFCGPRERRSITVFINSPVVRRFALGIRDSSGAAIDVEVWALPSDAVGDFLAKIPSPLGLGTVNLEDGTRAHGFLWIDSHRRCRRHHAFRWLARVSRLLSLEHQPGKELNHATA